MTDLKHYPEKWDNPFMEQMQLELIILSEVSPKEKDKYHMISLKRGI